MFSTDIIIRYGETDGMGIVHHGVHAIWLEHARCQWLATKGLPYEKLEDMGWHIPVLDLSIQYLKTIKFGDPISVFLEFEALKGPKFAYRYQIKRREELLVTARTEHVFLEKGVPRRIPPFFKELIKK